MKTINSIFFFVSLVLLITAKGFAGSSNMIESDVKGFYLWGAEVESFMPCNSNKEYWVLSKNKKLSQQLVEKYTELTKNDIEPYGKVYAVFDGYFDTKSERDGYAENYDGYFVVTNIRLVKNKANSKCNRK